MYVYSFGAPDNGKGIFDGIGGALKNKIHSLIKGAKTVGMILPVQQVTIFPASRSA